MRLVFVVYGIVRAWGKKSAESTETYDRVEYQVFGDKENQFGPGPGVIAFDRGRDPEWNVGQRLVFTLSKEG